MKVDRYTILHRKDERGVIIESGVFGPKDEIPEGFEASTVYTKAGDTELYGEDVQIAESVLTPWGKPDAPNTVAMITGENPLEVPTEDIPSAAPEDFAGAPEPPPQGGPGSGKEAWAAYADALGVEVDDDASRDDIIDAVEKAGHPV